MIYYIYREITTDHLKDHTGKTNKFCVTKMHRWQP